MIEVFGCGTITGHGILYKSWMRFMTFSNDLLMKFRWWISAPRNRRASRACQYACLPAPVTLSVLMWYDLTEMHAPKMTTSCTFFLFLKSIRLAKAVLKAVISAALTIPRGVPSRLSRVKLPLGLVVWPFIFAAFISAVMSGGTSNGVVWLLMLVLVAPVDPDPRDMELTREFKVRGSLLLVLPSRVLLEPLGLAAESVSERLPMRPVRFGSP